MPCTDQCGLRGLNYPYRGWKDSFFEGGFRGLGYVWASKGMLKSPGRTYKPLLHVTDWYSTLLSAALSRDTPSQHAEAKIALKEIMSQGPIDSVDHWNVMSTDGSEAPREEIVLAGIDVDKQGAALRVGDLKLLVGSWGIDTWCDLNMTGYSPSAPAPVDPNPKYHGPGGAGGVYCTRINGSGTSNEPRRKAVIGGAWWETVFGLYNVTADPRELNDLQHSLPEQVAKLKQRLIELNSTTAGTIHLPEDPAGHAKANDTQCWSPWRLP